jgi:redox-sensing transcriptional repressor
MDQNEIPNIIISRLPVYLRALRRMQREGSQTISSQELGEQVGVSAAQIRKDVSQFGEFGKQGMGYDIAFLIGKLSEILHIDRVWDIAVIGIGNMGHAIARYQGFTDRGFRVAMLFDMDPDKIGTTVDRFIIRDTAEMITAIKEAGIQIAMLCVPASAAQAVTNQLIQAGIRAILNYSPINLSVPPDVLVQYLDPSVGLQRMTYYLGK